MMITVYVDWEERRILNKEEFKMDVDTLVENIKEDRYERNERLEDFLDEKELNCVDLFDMSEVERQALVKEFEEWLVGDAEAQLLGEYFEEVRLEL